MVKQFRICADADAHFCCTDLTFHRACCGSGDFGENGCNSSAPLCQDRSSFFFWDRFHPTDAVSAITAGELFDGAAGRFVHPVNVHQLVA